MRVLRVVLLVVVALLIACPVIAQEKKEGRKGRRGGQGFDPMARLLEGLNLTAEQKAKVEDVKKEFAPKMAEIEKKRAGVFTDEQKKARADAEKAARDAGKSPREVAQAAREAVKPTEEQKTKLAEIMKETRDLMTQRMDKIKAILTPEQKEQLDKRVEEFKKGGKKKRD